MSSTILIVDDSKPVRNLIRGDLESMDVRLLEAANGRAALEILAHESVDLVLSDLLMPEMDGWAFIHAVRENPRYESIPILVVTVESAEDLKRKGREAGAAGWIVKPFRPESLRLAVTQILEHRTLHDESEEATVPSYLHAEIHPME